MQQVERKTATGVKLCTSKKYVKIIRYITKTFIINRDTSRLSPSPFVFCEIYEYCMTFEETVSPDKRTFLTHFRK